ncbi:MAG: hypothetical protein IPI58_02055 [Alphaproteobacteria bacterium]|nr:MAG: hypothetical protein IPI58_02055 [Alphaproteobacteria bacterium]
MNTTAENGNFHKMILPNHLKVTSMVALDRATMMLLITVWLAALLMVGMAVFTTGMAFETMRQSHEAKAIIPIVPSIRSAAANSDQVKEIGKRIEKMFTGIKTEASSNTLRIFTGSADMYMSWVTSLGYVDVIQRDVRWSIRDMCVGSECSGSQSSLMSALLIAESFTFEEKQ